MNFDQFSLVHSLSRVRLCDPINHSTPALPVHITNSWSLLKLMSESVIPSNHLILCRPLLLLPSIFPNIRVFSNKSALRIRWPKYWSFSCNISPGCSLEGMMLKLKLQYFGHLTQRADSLEKTLMLGEIEGRKREGNRG